MAHLVMSALQHVQFWMDFFPYYLAQMITSMERLCRTQWPLTPTFIFKVIQLWFAIKLLKYGTSCCCVHFTGGRSFLNGFFPYLAQMITTMRGCVMCNDLWAWPTYSRSFSSDFAIKLLKYSTSCCVHSTTHSFGRILFISFRWYFRQKGYS